MIPQEAENLKKNIVIEMVLHPQGSLDVNVKMEDKEIQKHFEELPAILPTNQGTLSFFQTTDSVSSKKNEEVSSPVKMYDISQLPLASL